MAGAKRDGPQARAIRRAAMLVTEAMDLLDAHGGPPAASAHLDLALECLRKSIGRVG